MPLLKTNDFPIQKSPTAKVGLATPEKGKAFAECTIGNLVEFARLFREMPRGADADLNHQSEAL